MKGFVPTPPATVDKMVDILFQERWPTAEDCVLDPGCGTGAFVDGIIRWCAARQLALPRITAVESDPRHLDTLLKKFSGNESICIEHRDYLAKTDSRAYRYIVGNPPYVPITQLSEKEKHHYRASYTTARGRFDLYLLFFEQALRNLAPSGRLVFITPEKFLYVESAAALREMLASKHIERIWLEDESTFGDLVTYPTITVLKNSKPEKTCFKSREGVTVTVQLPFGGASWFPMLSLHKAEATVHSIRDCCMRISCGIATGSDCVFVQPEAQLSPELRAFAKPTISGRELAPGEDSFHSRFQMLLPYHRTGELLDEDSLGALGRYLSRGDNKARLLRRTCVARKPWYAFHETPNLREILRPKILCKDICRSPHFVADFTGEIIPRHSVYYLVPDNPLWIPELLRYLRSEYVTHWLEANCQRAAKGYLRLQSHVLQRIPIAPGTLDGLGKDDIVPATARTDGKLQLALPV